MPEITDNRRLYFRDAYHPILYLNNKQKGNYASAKPLNNRKQNYCNSGPNAGGKTISLKTVGLLQLMLQSGMLFQFMNAQKPFIR
jgi:DNA mismatch repair protein MutS2